MIPLTTGMSYVDLNFAGRSRVIAAAVLHGPGGVAIIDPGPAGSLPVLRAALESAGIALSEVTAVLLTHIHLDHAGACGTLVRELPTLKIYTHRKGAPHLIDPAKLVASATQLFGDSMALWGEIRPVPAENIILLEGGERVQEGGRDFEVIYTPGHASHHVSYFNRDSAIAFVGDTCGIRVKPGGGILPPTPPPDIDLELWRESVARIRAWDADTLFLTHFGPSMGAPSHLTDFLDRLEQCALLAMRSLAIEGDDNAREAWYIAEMGRLLRTTMSEADARACETAGRLDLSWRGLARYWKKREGR